MVTLGQLGLYGMDTDGDMRTMRRAVDSVLDFQNQFKDENDFNVSYAYPKKYKGKTRTDVNARSRSSRTRLGPRRNMTG